MTLENITYRCSLCSRTGKEVNLSYTLDRGYICDDCIKFKDLETNSRCDVAEFKDVEGCCGKCGCCGEEDVPPLGQ